EARCTGGEERNPSIRAQPIRAVAHLAVLLIQNLAGRRSRRATATASNILVGPHEMKNSRIVVRDHVHSARSRLTRCAAKERTPVTCRDVHRVLVADWSKQSL